MAGEISSDRKDRITALTRHMNRLDNSGLTIDEKQGISYVLQVESVRAQILMLEKNFVLEEDLKKFVSKDDLEDHCTEHHGEKKDNSWPAGRIISGVLKMVVVCVTLTGWIKMNSPTPKEASGEKPHQHHALPGTRADGEDKPRVD